MITPSYVFTFGKYKGKKITEIIENDTKYVIWCNKNIKDFDFNIGSFMLHYLENKKLKFKKKNKCN